MAQFTAQGRVKLLFNGEGISFGFEPKDPFHFKVRSIQPHKRRFKFSGSTTRIYSSSSLNKPTNFSAEAHFNVGDESVNRENEVVDHDFDADDDDEDDEFVRDDLACFRGLVLDISYRPINVVCWKRAICLEFMEKADVLEYYDQTVNSPSGSFYIPAVLRVPHLLQVVKRRRINSNLSRKNILFRDGYTCQFEQEIKMKMAASIIDMHTNCRKQTRKVAEHLRGSLSKSFSQKLPPSYTHDSLI